MLVVKKIQVVWGLCKAQNESLPFLFSPDCSELQILAVSFWAHIQGWYLTVVQHRLYQLLKHWTASVSIGKQSLPEFSLIPSPTLPSAFWFHTAGYMFKLDFFVNSSQSKMEGWLRAHSIHRQLENRWRGRGNRLWGIGSTGQFRQGSEKMDTTLVSLVVCLLKHDFLQFWEHSVWLT